MKYLFGLFLCCSLVVLSFAQEAHPNILFIIADDLGNDAIEGFGLAPGPVPNTPNLKALQSSGVSYMNNWASPVCAPSRAAIMSGKYGINNGVMRVPGNLDLVHESIFRYIDRETQNTYATAVIGKWHLSNPVDLDHPEKHGVDHFEGIIRGVVNDYYRWDKVTNGIESEEDEYITTHLTNSAINWIDQQRQPWLLWLAHIAPHSPFELPPDDLYSIEDPSTNLEIYQAMIEALDHEIGRLLDSMDEETRENTIIVFVGDNGTPNPVLQYYPNGHSKSSLYEGGVRVPMIISGNGVSRTNEKEYGLTQALDLYATFIELTTKDLDGGIYNSLSLKKSLTEQNQITRKYIYTDYQDNGVLHWAIRSDQYKLIENENGLQEFYRIDTSALEIDNLINALTPAEELVLADMVQEANIIRSDWSCQDGIKNGSETAIDHCKSTCSTTDVLGFENIGCCDTPTVPSVYYEFIENNQRHIYSNGFPNHNYCYNPNNIPVQVYNYFKINEEPIMASQTTPIIRENGRPARHVGVALNGVILSPAPGLPFVYSNPNTGEMNWDWVFEPTTNQGDGNLQVKLDCATAHTNGDGYHYHGEMFEYLESTQPGITSVTNLDEVFQVGWASDGFPIVYKFGPDEDGVIRELQPSFQLKSGERPGDGIVAPCGLYSGKYTNDFEYIEGLGDLDLCNGIKAELTLETGGGIKTFAYYYVVTSSFPQISRCLVGEVSLDFENGAQQLSGVDNDGDGFLASFDCDDNDPNRNPVAVDIPDNDIDENCDGADLTTAIYELAQTIISIYPNPTRDLLNIEINGPLQYVASVWDIEGKQVIKESENPTVISLHALATGTYILELRDLESNQSIRDKISKIK